MNYTRIITMLTSCMVLMFISSCTIRRHKQIESLQATEVIRQIIRSRLCTLAKIRGIDKRTFPGEGDADSSTYSLLNNFSSISNRQYSVREINHFLFDKSFDTLYVSKNKIFDSNLLSIRKDTSVTLCSKNQVARIIAKPTKFDKLIGPLAISKPIWIKDSIFICYYEFGNPKSMVAGFSMFKSSNLKNLEPIYEEILWEN